MNHALASLILVCIVLLTPASGQRRRQKEPPQPITLRVSTAVPSLAPLAETEPSQVKGGLRITMQPEPFRAEEAVVTEIRQVAPPTFLGIISAQPSQDSIYVERTYVPKLKVLPDRLVLRLKLNNQMPRVFRGSGIAVQFNVAGKVLPVDSSAYGDLLNLILPPRSEQEITIVGPAITDIPAPSTIGIFFFDVVTNMDQSGNVTDKQNFEWYYSYQKQNVEKETKVHPAERLWMKR